MLPYIIAFAVAVAAYLFGSINFAIIFSGAFKNVDVRNYGSGNAGATNVLRVAGKKAGILTFAADAFKGAMSSTLGFLIFKYVLYNFGGTVHPVFCGPYGAFICGILCMIGHCWPIFFQFRGGKAAATSVGIFAVCCWPAIVAGLVGFAVTVAVRRMVSLGSLVATVIVVAGTGIAAFTGFYGSGVNPWVITVISVLQGLLVFLRHKDNIERLANGKEKQIDIKKD